MAFADRLGSSGIGGGRGASGAVKGFIIGASVLFVFALGFFGGSIVEGVDQNEIVVIQYPRGGMHVAKSAGWAPQWFGKVSRYSKRGKIDYPLTQVDGDKWDDQRLAIAFNDNGRARLASSIQYTMPMVDEHILKIHAAYPDQQSLENGLIKPPVAKAVFVTGQLMTTYESYKDKRSQLVEMVEDQAQMGAYRTRSVERTVEEDALDPQGNAIKVKKQVIENVVVMDSNGVDKARSEKGQLSDFNIDVFGFTVNDIDYSPEVDEQIKGQQAIEMSMKTSMANARKAQQDAVTAEAQGRANVATARSEQEIDKTKAIVQGEKARDLAKLSAEAATFYKQESILKADADSQYRSRMMAADGALGQKLDAYKFGVSELSKAFATHRLVPDVMIGGGSGAGQQSTLEQVMQLILVNQAKQLGLDLSTKQ